MAAGMLLLGSLVPARRPLALNDCRAAAAPARGDFCGRFSGLWTDKGGKRTFQKVQIIQQNSASALDPKLPIGRSIEEPLLCFFQMGKVQRRERCRQLMGALQPAGGLLHPAPSELSGRRTETGGNRRALAAEPQCLIFDEATNGFDLPLRKKSSTRL